MKICVLFVLSIMSASAKTIEMAHQGGLRVAHMYAQGSNWDPQAERRNEQEAYLRQQASAKEKQDKKDALKKKLEVEFGVDVADIADTITLKEDLELIEWKDAVDLVKAGKDYEVPIRDVIGLVKATSKEVAVEVLKAAETYGVPSCVLIGLVEAKNINRDGMNVDKFVQDLAAPPNEWIQTKWSQATIGSVTGIVEAMEGEDIGIEKAVAVLRATDTFDVDHYWASKIVEASVKAEGALAIALMEVVSNYGISGYNSVQLIEVLGNDVFKIDAFAKEASVLGVTIDTPTINLLKATGGDTDNTIAFMKMMSTYDISGYYAVELIKVLGKDVSKAEEFAKGAKGLGKTIGYNTIKALKAKGGDIVKAVEALQE